MASIGSEMSHNSINTSVARAPDRHQATWTRGRARPRGRRRCARLLEGHRGDLSRHQASAVLGSGRRRQFRAPRAARPPHRCVPAIQRRRGQFPYVPAKGRASVQPKFGSAAASIPRGCSITSRFAATLRTNCPARAALARRARPTWSGGTERWKTSWHRGYFQWRLKRCVFYRSIATMNASAPPPSSKARHSLGPKPLRLSVTGSQTVGGPPEQSRGRTTPGSCPTSVRVLHRLRRSSCLWSRLYSR